MTKSSKIDVLHQERDGLQQQLQRAQQQYADEISRLTAQIEESKTLLQSQLEKVDGAAHQIQHLSQDLELERSKRVELEELSSRYESELEMIKDQFQQQFLVLGRGSSPSSSSSSSSSSSLSPSSLLHPSSASSPSPFSVAALKRGTSPSGASRNAPSSALSSAHFDHADPLSSEDIDSHFAYNPDRVRVFASR